jgi:TonB family protein
VRLTLDDGRRTKPFDVLASSVADKKWDYYFTWPTANAKSISVKSATSLAAGLDVSCVGSQTHALEPSTSEAAKRTFDDTNVTFGDEAVAAILRSADMSRRVQPDYPLFARERGITGTVIIEVTIGAGGSLVDAHVYKSSGSPLLDDAALKAAQLSTYVEPQLNGHVVVRPYLIEYDFVMR